MAGKKYKVRALKVFPIGFTETEEECRMPALNELDTVVSNALIRNAIYPDIELPEEAIAITMVEDTNRFPLIYLRITYLIPILE